MIIGSLWEAVQILFLVIVTIVLSSGMAMLVGLGIRRAWYEAFLGMPIKQCDSLHSFNSVADYIFYHVSMLSIAFHLIIKDIIIPNRMFVFLFVFFLVVGIIYSATTMYRVVAHNQTD